MQTLTIVWEFLVRPGKRRQFEEAYGPHGDWVKFFREGDGYIRTELLRDQETQLRYLTLDHWASRQAYLEFKKQNRVRYAAMDRKCEPLTRTERLVGQFTAVHAAGPALARHWEIEESHPAWPVVVRAATPKDIPAIMALERESASAAHWPHSVYKKAFAGKACPRITLVAGGPRRTVHGFVIGRVTAGECELENIVVSPRHQRHGIGSRLLQALVERARARGAARIFLEVRESNEAARALYERCGFAATGRRRNYYDNPREDAVLYSLAERDQT
ncbi:MAG TPA: ribosomal protein S18-alanine N-acetyltransferase [Terriglobales bacterium]|nr:ribosomal protein S18-alanine N-acetyltransferase [Terriglobales bacterium]